MAFFCVCDRFSYMGISDPSNGFKKRLSMPKPDNAPEYWTMTLSLNENSRPILHELSRLSSPILVIKAENSSPMLGITFIIFAFSSSRLAVHLSSPPFSVTINPIVLLFLYGMIGRSGESTKM